MNPLASWFQASVPTFLLAALLWFGRKSIGTYITKGLEFKFDKELEKLRADLKTKENEITSLRSGALTAMTTRQMALDKRRLEAVDHLWSSLIDLAPAKVVSSFMSVVKFEACAEDAVTDPKMRQVFEDISKGLDLSKINYSCPLKARPYVSSMAWSIFSAYQAIAMQAVIKLQILRTGISSKNLINNEAVANLVKVALPHQKDYVEKYGDAGYFYLLQELEERLLEELKKMLLGEEADKESLALAAQILRLSNELTKSSNRVNLAGMVGI